MSQSKLDEHVMAALSHLREAENEMEEEQNPVRCVAQGQLRAARSAVEDAANLLGSDAEEDEQDEEPPKEGDE